MTVQSASPEEEPGPSGELLPSRPISITEFRRFLMAAVDVLEEDWRQQAELPEQVALEEWWTIFSGIMVPELLVGEQAPDGPLPI